MTVAIRHGYQLFTKVGLLHWYAEHFPHMREKSLVTLVTHPDRFVIDQNARTAAILTILEKKGGITHVEEVRPLLDTLKDESDYPVTEASRNAKENDAYFRSEVALALAKYGVENSESFEEFKHEFIQTIRDTIHLMVADPLFPGDFNISSIDNKYFGYCTNFLAALHAIDQTSADPIIKALGVALDDIYSILRTNKIEVKKL